jgi:hypothetical protein
MIPTLKTTMRDKPNELIGNEKLSGTIPETSTGPDASDPRLEDKSHLLRDWNQPPTSAPADRQS